MDVLIALNTDDAIIIVLEPVGVTVGTAEKLDDASDDEVLVLSGSTGPTEKSVSVDFPVELTMLLEGLTAVEVD